MNRFNFTAAILAVSVSAAAALSNDQAANRNRPNILLAIADDWSFGHTSAFGCQWINTPAFDRAPGYWPDNETVRNDMLDYGFEVERFDRHLGRMLELIEKRGELDNTLVVVTSDHGMPFPRAKGNAYDESNHVPLDD